MLMRFNGNLSGFHRFEPGVLLNHGLACAFHFFAEVQPCGVPS